MHESEPHPIDLAVLERGSVLDQETVEKAIVDKLDTDAGRLKMLSFKTWLQAALEERWADGPVVVRQCTRMIDDRKDVGLKILTNVEAAEYLPRNQAAHMGRVVQRHGQMLQLDQTELDADQKRRLDSDIERSAAVTLAMLQAQKEAAKIERAKRKGEIEG